MRPPPVQNEARLSRTTAPARARSARSAEQQQHPAAAASGKVWLMDGTDGKRGLALPGPCSSFPLGTGTLENGQPFFFY